MNIPDMNETDWQMVARMLEQAETTFKLLQNQAQNGIAMIRQIRRMIGLPED